MWDLSSPSRDWTSVPCIGKQTLYHWTIWEVPWKRVLTQGSVSTREQPKLCAFGIFRFCPDPGRNVSPEAGTSPAWGSFSICCSCRCRAPLRLLSTCSSAESGRVSASQLEFVKLSETGDLKINKKIGEQGKSFFILSSCLLKTLTQANIRVLGSVKACCCSVSESRLTLCDSMDCSMLAFPVHH